MSSPGVPSSVPGRRQKRMGPAPFASFEDLSDEVRSHLESPEDKNAAGSVVRLPGIREDLTPSTPAKVEIDESVTITTTTITSSATISTSQFVYTGISLVGAACAPQANSPSSTTTTMSTNSQGTIKLSLQTPSTPRIDISRASSSSHHEDSRDSTPDRELFEGHDAAGAKLGLGFREEGTLDLRSSTEELDFHEQHVQQKGGGNKAKSTRPQSPCYDSSSYASQQQQQQQNRKDSQSSELGLLSISGRTSRLSSIGSQGSAQSRLSNASHLSVVSGQSGGLSRSPSPHKMLLETSFCGTKAQESAQQIVDKEGTKNEEDIEHVILARKHDPTKAILAEGIIVESRPNRSVDNKPSTVKVPPEKPARTKIEKNVQNVKSDITITVDKPQPSAATTTAAAAASSINKLPKTIVSQSGVVYTYIPLKGPLPKDAANVAAAATTPSGRVNVDRARSTAGKATKSKSRPAAASSSHHQHRQDEPKYIRIKLKPDHMYDESQRVAAVGEIQKPATLNLNDTNNKRQAQSFAEIIEKNYTVESTVITTTAAASNNKKSISRTPSASPKPTRHQMLKEVAASSKSPSPSLSRRSSFCSLFKSKEGVLSPDSPTAAAGGHKRKNTLTGIIRDASDNLRERRRSRSKSRDRDRTPTTSVGPSSTESIDSKGKQKSVFSIFKGKKSCERLKDEASSSDGGSGLHSMDGIEFKFKPEATQKTRKYHETQLDGESIRIPLHSPTYYESRDILQELRTSSQDSQETVIEAAPKHVESVTVSSVADAIADSALKEEEIVKKPSKEEFRNRQSSTSSENIVFSTKLGSDNAIFTTKLPKEKHMKKLIAENHFAKCHAELANDLKELQTDGLDEDVTEDVSAKKEEIKIVPEVVEVKQAEIVSETKASKEDDALKKETAAVAKSPEIKQDCPPKKPETSQRQSPDRVKQPDDTLTIRRATSSDSLGKDLTPQTPDKPLADIKLKEKYLKTSHNKLVNESVDNSIVDDKIGDIDDDRHSSESEKDSECEFVRNKSDRTKRHVVAAEPCEPERKGLVLQQDSFDEELPYVPTTLPLERSVAVPIVPIKQRGNMEIKTYPIERPRSTTPIIPSSLEDYYCDDRITAAHHHHHQMSDHAPNKPFEKLKISLPKDEDRTKSPRSNKSGNTNWFEFAEKGLTSQRQTPTSSSSHESETIVPPSSTTSSSSSPPPPPLPPKGVHKEWINFEEIPERRKPPKRIQTIPSRGTIDVPESVLQENVVYSYVNPEDCKCECHEINARGERERKTDRPDVDEDGEQPETTATGANKSGLQEDELPLLLPDETVEEEKTNKSVEQVKLDVTILDRRSIVSDSSVDLSASVEHSETNGIDQTLQTPFTSDLGVSSNRSSIISQDEPQSPESGTPNAFLKS